MLNFDTCCLYQANFSSIGSIFLFTFTDITLKYILKHLPNKKTVILNGMEGAVGVELMFGCTCISIYSFDMHLHNVQLSGFIV